MINEKITVYTQVYNTEKYLRKCLDSVVNQNYPIHQYIIVDNGCTDGCSEIIKEYAEKYDFIEVVKHETNQRSFSYRLISDKATGDYLAYIDSDDWWEPGYLEKLMSFLVENDLDLSLTGSLKYIEETGERQPHSSEISQNVVLTQKQFAKNYEKYQMFPAALWGSVMKLNVYKNINGDELLSKVKTMPGDTVLMLDYIKNCNKIGIRNDKLYNYRIRKSSVTYEYNPERFSSTLAYREILIDFLKKNDAYDDYYKEWVKMIFFFFMNSIIDTLNKSDSAPEIKISEGLKVFKHELVQQSLQDHFSGNKIGFLINIRELLTQNVAKLEKNEDKETAKEFLELLSPTLGRFFDYNHVLLYAENPDLWNALLNNNVLEFIKVLLDLINKTDSTDIDLAGIIIKVIPENTLLYDVKSKEFFELYSEVCKLILNNNNTEALSEMIEIMLSGNELECPDDFLNVFVTLAALENNVDAFIFGNIQKAYLFIDEKRSDEAKQIVTDLLEMGLSDNEDVIELQKLLNN